MAQARIWRWVGLALLAVVAVVVAAVAAAQDGAGGPNAGLEEVGPPGNTLPLEEMAGRSPNDEKGEAAAAAGSPVAPAPNAAMGVGRRFLVTNVNANGDEPLAACPAGFHMASLYELHDVTTLIYASDHVSATVRGDQGAGSAAGWWGWVRTGGQSSGSNTAGVANCMVWTSGAEGTYGTLVQLDLAWTGAGSAISPWRSQTWACNGPAPVWCIED